MLVGRDVPQLLDAQPVNLRVAVAAEVEDPHKLLRQMSAATLGKEGVFGVELQPRLIVRLVLAVARDPHVAGGDALDRPVVVEQHLGRREARKDLDPQLFRLPRQPAAQIGERAGVGVLVVEERRGPQVRQGVPALLGQHPVDVLGHRHLGQRAAVLAPVGEQLVERARVDHRPRQDVRADLGPLLQHADREFGLFLGGKLFQPDRRAEAGRPRADNHHVVRHRFARRHSHLQLRRYGKAAGADRASGRVRITLCLQGPVGRIDGGVNHPA